MPSSHAEASEVSILARILRPDAPTFSPQGARDILALDFDQADKDRMRELSAKAHAGTLSADEAAEAGRYELLGHLLSILQSKARQSLRLHREGANARSAHTPGGLSGKRTMK
jgi:hypothetical protein